MGKSAGLVCSVPGRLKVSMRVLSRFTADWRFTAVGHFRLTGQESWRHSLMGWGGSPVHEMALRCVGLPFSLRALCLCFSFSPFFLQPSQCPSRFTQRLRVPHECDISAVALITSSVIETHYEPKEQTLSFVVVVVVVVVIAAAPSSISRHSDTVQAQFSPNPP